jgi:hypothetical protein
LRGAANKGAPPGPVRILFLSRRSLSEWASDITQARAERYCDAQEVSIGKLDSKIALTLFKDAARRFAQHRGEAAPRFDDAAITAWLAENDEVYSLPLLITAAAIHLVDFPEDTLSLRGARIVEALVNRERTQLDRVGRDAGWDEEAASRLIGLAALRDGLDDAALRRLADPALGLGLPHPTKVVDAVRHRFGRPGDKGLVAPGPDIVASELLRQVLKDGGDRSPEWVWATLAEPDAVQVELLDRRIHDSITLHGPAEKLLLQKLIKTVSGRLKRAAAWKGILDSQTASFRIGTLDVAIAQTLLDDPQLGAEGRAEILGNLSNGLYDAGDGAAALAASRDAVELYRRLTQLNPARFDPDLARSLNYLSHRLSDAGDSTAALAASREAEEIRRRLADENPARFNPDLASSLSNQSIQLSYAGDSPAALAAIRKAVELRRRLADENPARFNPDLASSLHNLSLCLSDAGDDPAALAAVREAVKLRQRLADENPARFNPDLASSLHNLSLRLKNAGEGPGALAAIDKALGLYRRLADENPARFNPDLASSLNNLSLRLNDAGDGLAALAAMREAVDLYQRLADENPAHFGSLLERSLDNLSILEKRHDIGS